MLFNSVSFLVFFPIVVILYYFLPARFRWILLLVASIYFYMAFVPVYILVLFYLILTDYTLGRLIERSSGKKRRLLLSISIAVNVGTLFVFKYFNFFNDNIAHIAQLLHWNYSIQALRIILPLGLSFHVFQSLAYVIEVYHNRFPAERHLGIYALYVMFFPQLVAGPIEHPQHLLPQLHATHGFDERNVSRGLKIMLWGFFKKVVVADTAGTAVDTIYGGFHPANGAMFTIAIVAFAIQLYGDFSGYSDIARGSAKVFGVDLINNFNRPYLSKSIAEFWRRWHISLGNWFRDYFYYPLALSFSKGSKAAVYAALLITFTVIGLWHGANWTFIIFGMIFGSYMAIGLFTKQLRNRIAEFLRLLRLSSLHSALKTLTTFILVSIGFVFFRAQSLHQVVYILGNLENGWTSFFTKPFWNGIIYDVNVTGLLKPQLFSLVVSSTAMLGGEYLEEKKNITAWLSGRSRWFRWGSYYLLIIWMLLFGYYKQRTFIYFQF